MKRHKTDTVKSESLHTSPCFFSGGTFAENLYQSCKEAWSDISSLPFLVHTAVFKTLCLPFQQKGCILLSILLIIHCLCVRVCWIRGNPLGKWANLSIWTCFFLLSPSPTTVCSYSSLLWQQQAESSLLQTADGLHMICVLDWHHSEEMCVRFCRVKHIFFLPSFSPLSDVQTHSGSLLSAARRKSKPNVELWRFHNRGKMNGTH